MFALAVVLWPGDQHNSQRLVVRLIRRRIGVRASQQLRDFLARARWQRVAFRVFGHPERLFLRPSYPAAAAKDPCDRKNQSNRAVKLIRHHRCGSEKTLRCEVVEVLLSVDSRPTVIKYVYLAIENAL